MSFYINEDKCTGCGYCVDHCYFNAIEDCRKNGDMSGVYGSFYYSIIQDKCVKCGKCAAACPIEIIEWTDSTPAPRTLTHVEIVPELCKGCSICGRFCPVEAISGKLREPYTVDQALCVKCGYCIQKCNFNAIMSESADK